MLKHDERIYSQSSNSKYCNHIHFLYIFSNNLFEKMEMKWCNLCDLSTKHYIKRLHHFYHHHHLEDPRANNHAVNKIKKVIFRHGYEDGCNLSIIHGEISALKDCSFSLWTHLKVMMNFFDFFQWKLRKNVKLMKQLIVVCPWQKYILHSPNGSNPSVLFPMHRGIYVPYLLNQSVLRTWKMTKFYINGIGAGLFNLPL